MVVLWEEDGQTVGAVGRKLSLESNTLTPLLKRLEGLDFVTRIRSVHDERQVIVRLTGAGRAPRQRTTKVPGCMFELLGLDLETLTHIRGGLAMLREKLAKGTKRCRALGGEIL